MGIIVWIIFGAIVGFIASHIMGSGDGLVWDIIIGIVGAMLGGFIMNAFGRSGVTGFNFYSFIVAILGALALLWIVRAFRRKA